MWAIYSKNDWRPGVAFTLRLTTLLWAQIWAQRGKPKKPAIREPDREAIP
jgi:hypothetical protein